MLGSTLRGEFQFLWREASAVAILLIAQAIHPWAGALGLAALILWSMRGPRAVVQALSACILLLSANPALTGPRPMVPALKWLLVIACAARLCFPSGLARIATAPRWAGPLSVFAGSLVVLTPLYSYNPSLSYMKLASFLLGVTTILRAYRDAGAPSACGCCPTANRTRDRRSRRTPG